ncbi:ABC transporter permease [Sphaerothrix gracilis]|uniref:ABC transporter permease n=1 Tax=Sphaerothrix gracilis TaxID=3151835 RepID=UPI0031FC1BAD
MSYLFASPTVVLQQLWEHVQMVGITLAIAITLAIPLSLLITRVRRLAVPVMGVLGVFYTIPSLALIIFLVPVFGLNQRSVITAMVIYTQVILVRNLVVGLSGIDSAILEAAKGMGMSSWQRWWRVQVPLVLPVFLAGVRLAAVVAIAIATIGAKFSAGGLGNLLFEGIQTNRSDKIWAGAIAVALLALLLNAGLRWLEQAVSPHSQKS